jgi:hypothetical protein
MIIRVDRVPASIDETSFGDITSVPVTRIEKEDGQWTLEFSGDLTSREQWQVRIRLAATTQVAEHMLVALLDQFDDLRLIRGSTGTLTATQLSNAVRALAAAQIRIIRLLAGDLEGTAE